jgi:hypothetical protein
VQEAAASAAAAAAAAVDSRLKGFRRELAGRQAPAQLLPGNLATSTGVAMGVARMLEQAMEEPDAERGKSTFVCVWTVLHCFQPGATDHGCVCHNGDGH